MQRSFPSLKAKDAFDLVPVQDVTAWELRPDPYAPSDILLANLVRAQWFALTTSEAAKVTLIDTLLLEIIPNYPRLKVWKEETLESDVVGGIVDYLIAPRRGYVAPLLCAIEAKLDDFAAGEIQCIAEMAACRDINRRDGHDLEIYGIVSNGQVWVFYRLTRAGSAGIRRIHDERFAETARRTRPRLRRLRHQHTVGVAPVQLIMSFGKTPMEDR